MKLRKLFTVFIILLILLTNIQFSIFADDLDEENISNEEIGQHIISASNEASKDPIINSRAAIVIDRNTKTILYGKNESQVRPMASTTKVMTAIVVLENANLNQIVEVSKKAGNTGGSRLGLKSGDKVTVHDLLYGVMLKSGNDAAVAISEAIGGSVEGFAGLMNKKAKELGLVHTHFVTPHGLDQDDHYTTAYELALMADYALNIPKFKEIVGTKTYTVTINGVPRTIGNTNELLGNLSGVYGVKTGFTNKAGRCLVTSTKRDNLDLISVVLGADTKKFRTTDSIKIIEYCFKNYDVVNLKSMIDEEFQNWKNVNEQRINIVKGNYANLNTQLADYNITNMPIKKEDIKDIKIIINNKNILNAPIPSGTIIGNLQVKVDNKLICAVDILEKDGIKKKNIYNYFMQLLGGYKTYLELGA